jgi:hypothetical protein
MFRRDKPAAARDLNELTGDQHLVGNISDAPDPTEVNRDIEQMDHHFDYLGSGAYDARHEAERAMRDQIVTGNYEDPEQMFQHGAPMPTTLENAVRYSSGWPARFALGRLPRPDLGERWPSRLVATAEEDCLSYRWHVAHFMLVVVGQGSVLANERSLPATLHSLDMVEWPELITRR